MNQYLSQVAIVVADYDEALDFYTQKLHFRIIEDTVLTTEKRWVVVSPPGDSKCGLLLAKASNQQQITRVGDQTGGRVFLFLNTDDFERDYQNLIHHKIRVVSQPREEAYGRVCVFADLYGNLWDLIEPKK
jgi:catechol 2,3-dioxygenase-like lactoylglutathione lyase family enzyme